MTAPRLPHRPAFPIWALLLWLVAGLSVWPAQADMPTAPSSPVLVGDNGLLGLALPRDATGQWQHRDGGGPPDREPEPVQALLAVLVPATLNTEPNPRPSIAQTPASDSPRSHQSAPRAPPAL